MKTFLPLFFLAASLLLSCDPEKLFRDAPVIEEVGVFPERVNPYDTVFADVKASNPEEGELSYEWSVSPARGLFLDPTDRTAIRWIAPTTGGEYTLKIIVSNAYKSTESKKSVRVIETGIPLVRINAPDDGDYLVQWQEAIISVTAAHNNGINYVAFFVNDIRRDDQSGNSSGEYTFTFLPDSTFLGETEIKIEAQANFVPTVGADSVTVYIEAVLPRQNK